MESGRPSRTLVDETNESIRAASHPEVRWLRNAMPADGILAARSPHGSAAHPISRAAAGQSTRIRAATAAKFTNFGPSRRDASAYVGSPVRVRPGKHQTEQIESASSPGADVTADTAEGPRRANLRLMRCNKIGARIRQALALLGRRRDGEGRDGNKKRPPRGGQSFR
jgi:hypothetical protein